MRFYLAIWAALVLCAHGFGAESEVEPDASRADTPITTSELWMVDTRHLPQYHDQQHHAENRAYWKYSAAGDWIESSRADFNALDEMGAPICVLIPGAPISQDVVVQVSIEVFRDFAPSFPSDKPVRFVIWSWPKRPAYRRMLKSYRELANRAEGQAYYLADFVDSIDRRVPVCLIGFSFGTRISAAALQLLAGGPVAFNPPFARRSDAPQPIAAFFIAGAIDCDWLLPDHRYDLALSQVRHGVVTINSGDTTLARYPKLYGILRHCPQALGSVGTCDVSRLGRHLDRYEEIDITADVGRTHDPLVYLLAPALRSRFREIVLSLQTESE